MGDERVRRERHSPGDGEDEGETDESNQEEDWAGYEETEDVEDAGDGRDPGIAGGVPEVSIDTCEEVYGDGEGHLDVLEDTVQGEYLAR